MKIRKRELEQITKELNDEMGLSDGDNFSYSLSHEYGGWDLKVVNGDSLLPTPFTVGILPERELYSHIKMVLKSLRSWNAKYPKEKKTRCNKRAVKINVEKT